MRKTAKLLALLAIVLCGCAIRPPAAKAQFIGYTGPQTVQTSLATNLNCTGVAQNFTTGITPGFNNLGQTQHFVSVAASSSTTSLQFVIQGIDNSGNVFAISDVGQINGTIPASGYFPNIRVVVTCLPITATFSLNYSGASSTPIVNSGSYLNSQIDKLLFRAVSATVNQNTGTFATPFGSSSGRLIFQNPNTAGTGTLTVQCTPLLTGIPRINAFTFNIVNTINPQQFLIPADQCPQMQVAYVIGGVPTGTMFMEYIFDPPGLQPSSTQANNCTQVASIPAQNTANTVPISIGANATQLLVNNVSIDSYRIQVCGFIVSVGVAGTVQLTEGTGATCGTGTTNVSGAMSLVVGTPLTAVASLPIFSTNVRGDSLCITTAGGATAAGLLAFQFLPI